MARRIRIANGQIDLLGDIYNYNLKYNPHKEYGDDGACVIIVRIPQDASDIDKKASLDAALELSGKTKVVPNSIYWNKKPKASRSMLW